LLRDDLRDLDGLHRVPAVLRQGTLGPHPRRARGDDRRPVALRSGDLRRGRRDGRGVLHVRALGAAAAEGDGDHPWRCRAARRRPYPTAAASGAAAAHGPPRVVPAALGQARPAARHLWARIDPARGNGVRTISPALSGSGAWIVLAPDTATERVV